MRSNPHIQYHELWSGALRMSVELNTYRKFGKSAHFTIEEIKLIYNRLKNI